MSICLDSLGRNLTKDKQVVYFNHDLLADIEIRFLGESHGVAEFPERERVKALSKPPARRRNTA